ncbi:hypothetical protein IFO69_05640 [Echinicola sp. CAU 1574]|uniref:Uncharacterized protein n=1 Tax=Echinicola arenosa TaxID=2774144 RepID=A0ABR9AHL1_9BACT|nr:hypothetical protein [Echinicola arenosa]MBD8488221.1 hypothetical protein [Echinicola arenosa]
MKPSDKKIYFIEDNEDIIDLMVKNALSSTMEDNLKKYCQHLAFNFSLSGVDIQNHKMEKKIYFIEDNNVRKEK